MKTIIKDIAYLVAGGKTGQIQRNVDMLIEDGMITGIGRDLQNDQAMLLDASGMIVYPGLINTHHHFYQVLTRNIPEIQNLELFDWLLWLYQRWRHLTPRMLYDASMVAMGELVQFGCTTMVDHHYVFPKYQSGMLEAQFEAAEKLGVRLHACRGSMSLGESRGGLPPDDLVQNATEILEDSQRLIDAFHDPSINSFRQIILAPCSPFSVDAELMRHSAQLARDNSVLLHTHLAETEDEVQYCLDAFGRRPLLIWKIWDGLEMMFFLHMEYISMIRSWIYWPKLKREWLIAPFPI